MLRNKAMVCGGHYMEQKLQHNTNEIFFLFGLVVV